MKYIIPFFFLCSFLQADTVYLPNCSQSTVQSAVNSAIDGDVLVLPEGACTWMIPVVVSSKAVTIQGAGVGKTRITDRTGTSFQQSAIVVKNQGSKKFRTTGISFDGGTGGNGNFWLEGPCTAIRVDHCFFLNVSNAIRIRGRVNGVIDNCEFKITLNSSLVSIMQIADGAASWSRPHSLGDVDALYIEDCFFNYDWEEDSVIQGHNGARYVVRFCRIRNTLLDAHGNCGAGGRRGTFSYEVYGNTFTKEAVPGPNALFLRGGSGVVFDNVFTGGYNHPMMVTDYAVCNSVHGICKGYPPSCTYPCPDQIGRSTNQTLDPLYEWDNTWNGRDVDFWVKEMGCSNPSVSDIIRDDRDYKTNTRRPGYSPYTYPHPLREEVSAPSPVISVPRAPENVRVIYQ